MIKRNLKTTTLAVSGLLFCTTLWAGEFSSQTIRLAHTAAVSHAHHEAAQLFAKNVSDRTNGKVKVEIYPAGELGDQPALAEQVTLMALDSAVVSLGNLAMYSKKLNAMTAPFLFENYDHAHRTIDAFVMPWMNEGLAQHDAIGLSMFDYGFRQTGICQDTSKKLVRSLFTPEEPQQGLCPYASLPQDIFLT